MLRLASISPIFCAVLIALQQGEALDVLNVSLDCLCRPDPVASGLGIRHFDILTQFLRRFRV